MEKGASVLNMFLTAVSELQDQECVYTHLRPNLLSLSPSLPPPPPPPSIRNTGIVCTAEDLKRNNITGRDATLNYRQTHFLL